MAFLIFLKIVRLGPSMVRREYFEWDLFLDFFWSEKKMMTPKARMGFFLFKLVRI